MKIKSDAKEKVSFKWLKTLNKVLVENGIAPYIKVIFVFILIFSTILLWDTVSGLGAILLGFYTVLYVFNTTPGETGISLMTENLIWTSFMALLLTIAGSCNVYDKPSQYKEIPITKYELIESTEKMVVFPDKPFDKVMVLNLPSTTFFAFRDSIKTGSVPVIKIEKYETFDHIDKVFYSSKTSEIKYTLSVQVGNIEHKHGSVCSPNTNITTECDKLF